MRVAIPTILALQLLATLSAGKENEGQLHTMNPSTFVTNSKRSGRRTTYNRSSYPEYCSIPSAAARRSIPPLQFPLKVNVTHGSNNSTTHDQISTQLLQVISIIRHGARTPWKPLNCWKNYDTFLSNGNQWDCQLTSLVVAPTRPPPTNITTRKTTAPTTTTTTGTFIFEKRYDALQSPLHNLLNGTCMLGQLLDEGYDMELVNGQHLQSSYITTQNEHMKLFNSTFYNQRPYEESTYFRTDDEQRTIMSGQILISGLFDLDNTPPPPRRQGGEGFNQNGDENDSIPLHTADFTIDVLEPKSKTCPKLNELEYMARTSKEYRNFQLSKESTTLLNIVTTQLNVPKEQLDQVMDSMIDCLMTTYCTDRTLPHVLSDFRHDGDDSLFTRLYDYAVRNFTFPYTYNHSAYARLAMASLWSEIFQPLSSSKRATSLNDMMKLRLPRLMLISGHDVTVMPMLASLGDDVWDGKWIPYASMFLIEAYALTSGAHPNFPSNHGFRLIFNGRIITDRIDGCASELCDLDVLLNILEPIVLLVEDCNLSEAAPVSSRWSQIKERGVTIQQTIIIAIICCILSSIVTFTFVTGRLLCTNRYRHPKRAYEKVDGTGTAERKPSVDSTFSAAVDEYFDTAIEVPTPKNYTCLYGAADEAKNGDSSMNNRLDDRFVID